MKIKTRELKAGDTMASGEIVLKTMRKDKRLLVELFNPKNNKTRIASWQYNGILFVKDE